MRTNKRSLKPWPRPSSSSKPCRKILRRNRGLTFRSRSAVGHYHQHIIILSSTVTLVAYANGKYLRETRFTVSLHLLNSRVFTAPKDQQLPHFAATSSWVNWQKWIADWPVTLAFYWLHVEIVPIVYLLKSVHKWKEIYKNKGEIPMLVEVLCYSSPTLKNYRPRFHWESHILQFGADKGFLPGKTSFLHHSIACITMNG